REAALARLGDMEDGRAGGRGVEGGATALEDGQRGHRREPVRARGGAGVAPTRSAPAVGASYQGVTPSVASPIRSGLGEYSFGTGAFAARTRANRVMRLPPR